MRKIIIPIMLVLLSVPIGFTEDVVQPVVPETQPVAEPVEEVGQWSGLAFDILKWALSVGGSALALIVMAYVRKVTKKIDEKYEVDFDAIINEMAEKYIIRGIEKAEEWAKKQSDKPRSRDKKAMAIQEALSFALGNEKLTAWIKQVADAKVEELLKSNKTEEAVTPKEV